MNRVQIINTPTGPLSVIRPVAEKLLAEAVISGTLDGDLHAADAATVKAAMLVGGVCDFCSSPGANHVFDVPDFDMPNDAGRSTDGWAACDECAALVRAGKKAALLDRSLARMSFAKFSRQAIGELQARFWKGMEDKAGAAGVGAALADYVEDRLPHDALQPRQTGRDARIASVMAATGLTRREVDDLLAGKVARETLATLVKFEQRFGKMSGEARRTIDKFLADPKPPLADVVPHWQRALDGKFAAYAELVGVLKRDERAEFLTESVDLNDPSAIARAAKLAAARSTLRTLGFETDARLLRTAQAYSFNAETTAAIREAARSIPHDAPLSSIETPNTGAGWFWFAEPLPIASSPLASDRVNALLWGWERGEGSYELVFDQELLAACDQTRLDELTALAERYKGGVAYGLTPDDARKLSQLLRSLGVSREMLDRKSRRLDGEPSLVFSAYVVDERGQVLAKGTPAPSTRWHWPLSLTFHEMLGYNSASWERSYGPDGQHHGDAYVMGKDATLLAVTELSLFFVMACLWFKQTVPVLTREQGHVERHARKRIAREHKLDAPPTVQVVALRKSQRVPAEHAPAERQDGAREYHCRWIVAGHPRLQPCGPGRKDKKLIWIEAYPKGPEDKPLRTREKVYAVIR